MPAGRCDQNEQAVRQPPMGVNLRSVGQCPEGAKGLSQGRKLSALV